MVVLGVTGGSGTGKTTVSSMFAEYGAYVIDADIAARAVVEKGNPALAEIKKEFGSAIINSDGTLNRRALGDIVFAEPEKLKKLNDITHPYIADYIKKRLDQYSGGLALIDGAVLIESGIGSMCDYMCAVIAEHDTRMRRICERDKLTQEQAQARISAQKNDSFYIENADFIILNNEYTDALRKNVENILKVIELRKSK
jgi:dephospho-CoA kinase